MPDQYDEFTDEAQDESLDQEFTEEADMASILSEVSGEALESEDDDDFDFEFVGDNRRGSDTPNTNWPLEAQAILIKLQRSGLTAKKAVQVGVAQFHKAVEEGTIQLGEGEVNLPAYENLAKSWRGSGAGAVLSNMRSRWKDRFLKGDPRTVALTYKYGLIRRKGETQPLTGEEDYAPRAVEVEEETFEVE